jgi:hypothetical protein
LLNYEELTPGQDGQNILAKGDLDPIFVIGIGSSLNNRRNAMTVLKNGCIGLQYVMQPTYALQMANNSTIGVGSGIAYAWTTYSDSRLKENQTSLKYGLKEIMKLIPKQYIHHTSIDKTKWSFEDAPKTIGLVAQDVYNVIPEAVNVPKNEASDLWGLDYDKFIPVLVKAIQEQQQIIEKQQAEIDHLKSLENEVIELKTLVNTLLANQSGQGNK